MPRSTARGARRAIIDKDEGEVYFGGTKEPGQAPLAPTPLGGAPLKNCDGRSQRAAISSLSG